MKRLAYLALWGAAGAYFGITAVGGSPSAAGLCMFCGYMIGKATTKESP